MVMIVIMVMIVLIVRSLSGKNWQDRYKSDKVSISFPATPNDKINCSRVVKSYFFEITVPNICSCFTQSLYLIIRCWDIFQRHGVDNR